MADYIERDEVLRLIADKQKELCPLGRFSRSAVYGTDREKFDDWQEIADAIEAIPTASAHGRWIWADDGYLRCSECRQKAHVFIQYWDEPEIIATEYCPYCGAHMDEMEE